MHDAYAGPELIGIEDDYHDGDGRDEIIHERTQYFPDNYWKGLDWAREQQAKGRLGNFHKVASVPSIFYVKYLNEGFDISREPAREVVKRLKQDGLDAFVTTNRRV